MPNSRQLCNLNNDMLIICEPRPLDNKPIKVYLIFLCPNENETDKIIFSDAQFIRTSYIYQIFYCYILKITRMTATTKKTKLDKALCCDIMPRAYNHPYLNIKNIFLTFLGLIMIIELLRPLKKCLVLCQHEN